jgi:hypothetical protein
MKAYCRDGKGTKMKYTWSNPRKWDLANDRERRKAAQHYVRQARKARRQAAMRELFHAKRFSAFELYIASFASAALLGAVVWILR